MSEAITAANSNEQFVSTGFQHAGVKPNATLRELLRSAPESLRSRWRSALHEPANFDREELFSRLLEIWQDYHLDRYVEVQPRANSILSGRIRPQHLSDEEKRQFLDLLGIGLLNTYTKAIPGNESAYHLLNKLASFPHSAEVRSLIWAAMAEGLDAADFRRELCSVAQELRVLPNDSRLEWGEALRQATELVSEREHDESLWHLVSEATDNDFCEQVLRLIADEPTVSLEKADFQKPPIKTDKHSVSLTVIAAPKEPVVVAEAHTPQARSISTLEKRNTTDDTPEPQSPVAEPPRLSSVPSPDQPSPVAADHLALMRQAIVMALNRPVEITLNNGTRITATFATLGFDSALLREGGFLPLSDIRSFHPLEASANGICASSPSTMESPRTEQSLLVPQPAAKPDSSLVIERSVVGTTSATRHRPTPRRMSTIEKETLARIEQPFRKLVTDYKWQANAIPPLRTQKSPATDLHSTIRQRANKAWSQSLDYLRNRNWSAARDALIDLSFLTPSSIEPIWGAAYAASQQGDPKLALALLQHRTHLLERHAQLARAEVSLAIQINALPMVVRRLRAYAGEPMNLATDFLLMTCRHGLYRTLIGFLSEEGSYWAEYGSPLAAFLLRRVFASGADIPADLQFDADSLGPDDALPPLLKAAKDQPSQEYQMALAGQASLDSDLEALRSELEERENIVNDADVVNSILGRADQARRAGDFNDALRLAAQGLRAAKSRTWQERAEKTIEQLQAARPVGAKTQAGHGSGVPAARQPGPWLRQYLTSKDKSSFQHKPARGPSTSISTRTTIGPLWQQASYAANDGELDLAINLYKQFLDKAVQDRWDSQADRAVNGLAMVYARQGERDEAIKTMLRYREHIQGTQRFHNQIASLYFTTGQFQKSSEHFRLAAQAAAVRAERDKALQNARRAEQRADQAQSVSSQFDQALADEDAEELEREYLLEVDIKAPVQKREVTLDLDSFLEADIDRLLKGGEELSGITRSQVARGDFDYENVKRLERSAQEQVKTQGIRSRYLATALFLIYKKGWHQEPTAL
ncbi:MAG: hypothetical protein ACK2UI_15555, partial [Anaerolineae bacterium]